MKQQFWVVHTSSHYQQYNYDVATDTYTTEMTYYPEFCKIKHMCEQ